ncbi:ABC transporter permease subunit [Lapillicoccus sp.]|uniref:PhnE/PtxC family ABC transporter permease n=1 Tax=Lapillicoccus sp. TaxID=1909287 RepID=UPI0025E2304A|nr:ABC transporter permease subunit [Lapillicoccus sp.]
MSLDTRGERLEGRPGPPRETLGIRASTVTRRRLVGVTLVLAPAIWAFARALGSGTDVVNANGIPVLGRLLAAAGDPAHSVAFLEVVARAAGVTVVYAVLGTAAALVIGALGAVILSDVAWRDEPAPAVRAGRLVLRALLVAARSIHEVIWALLFLSVLGLDPLVAVLAIAVPFGAQTAKVYADILDAAPRQALSAMRARGAHSVPALAYGLLPPTAPLLLSYAFYRFECSLRSAVVLGVVGIGGLGAEIVVSLSSRNWDEVWTLIGAVVLLSAVVDLWSSSVRTDLAVASCSDWSAGSVAATSRTRSVRARWSAGTAVAALVVAWFASGVSWSGLVAPRTRMLTARLIDEMVPPALPSGGWPELGGAVLDTLSMAVLAMVLAVGLSVLLGPAATRVRPVRFLADPPLRWWTPRTAVRPVARVLLLLLRSVPPTVWAAIALLVLFPGILPGAVALGLYTGGILGRLVAEAWENIDLRPRDALRAAGVPAVAASLAAVLPPSSHHLVTYTLYRFEICVRDTAVVGVVGAAGLGSLFAENLDLFRFPVVTTLLLASLAVTVASEVAGRWVRKALTA